VTKLVFCLRRHPALTPEEFQRYWLEEHGPLVRSLGGAFPSARRYVQSHTLPAPANDALQDARGTAEPYDGITEIWLDEQGPAGNEAAIEAGMRLLEDERTFINLAESSIFYTIEHEIY
jgi:hypothetical protein